MVGISAVVEVDGRGLRRLVADGAEFWTRWCAVGFGADGVAELPGRRGLRLVRGRHLAVGSRYSVEMANPYLVDVVRADRDLVEYLVEGPDSAMTLRVHDPDLPGEVHIGLRGEVRELPVMGSDYTFTGSVFPSALLSGGRAVVGRLRFKRVRCRVEVGVEVRGDVSVLDVRVSGSPRGLLLPVLAVWPFVRGQVEKGFHQELAEAVRDLPEGLWDDFVENLANSTAAA
ncbi:hypothetical protein [Saccharothrix sp.]|uniref:hypothetical protein n=1 Tax=Saccharothrix sp. TaxID=1873460 RepID=UPI0028125866|nr:hypothetical protein [Saccharothrix sp.]